MLNYECFVTSYLSFHIMLLLEDPFHEVAYPEGLHVLPCYREVGVEDELLVPHLGTLWPHHDSIFTTSS